MKAFYGKFKCRLCGKEFIGMEVSNRATAVKAAVEAVTGSLTMTQAPTVVDIHNCESGNIGIADFIGFTKERGGCE